MEEINNFQQEPDENLYQAWERFKELLMKCPQHNLIEIQEVILFYTGLGIPTRRILESRGVIPLKTNVDAKNCTLMYETRQMMIPSHLNGASISVMPLLTYLNLRLGELAHIKLIVELADRNVKYPKGIAEKVLVRIESRIMGETLVLNRSLDHFFENYIELNDLNEPIELKRNQGDDMMPTIEDGEVIEEFRTRDDELDDEIYDYPSYCKDDKKIHIDCAYNLKFSFMIRFEFTHANFFLLFYVNMMSIKFHNSKMKDKMMYKGNNVVGALMNVPIFVRTFYVVTDFVVLENMDTYRNEGMGDVIFGKPFVNDVEIKTRRSEGMITIYNGNDDVTYQMVRSHQRFK
nr:hypothetical protein [Tanacetum cinerariifolium]